MTEPVSIPDPKSGWGQAVAGFGLLVMVIFLAYLLSDQEKRFRRERTAFRDEIYALRVKAGEIRFSPIPPETEENVRSDDRPVKTPDTDTENEAETETV